MQIRRRERRAPARIQPRSLLLFSGWSVLCETNGVAVLTLRGFTTDRNTRICLVVTFFVPTTSAIISNRESPFSGHLKFANTPE
jgi:hypothetical protein